MVRASTAGASVVVGTYRNVLSVTEFVDKVNGVVPAGHHPSAQADTHTYTHPHRHTHTHTHTDTHTHTQTHTHRRRRRVSEGDLSSSGELFYGLAGEQAAGGWDCNRRLSQFVTEQVAVCMLTCSQTWHSRAATELSCQRYRDCLRNKAMSNALQCNLSHLQPASATVS